MFTEFHKDQLAALLDRFPRVAEVDGYKESLNFANNLKEKLDVQIEKYGYKANDLLESVEFILKRKF